MTWESEIIRHVRKGIEQIQDATQRLRGQDSSPPDPVGAFWRQLDDHTDIYGALTHWRRLHTRDQFIIGLTPTYSPVFSGVNDAVLVLGPPGSGKCIYSGMEIVDPNTGRIHTIEEVVNKPELTHVLTLGNNLRSVEAVPITAKIDSGWEQTVRVTTASGRSVISTATHPYLTPMGWIPASDLEVGQSLALVRRTPEPLEPVPMDLEAIDVMAAMLTNGTFSGEDARKFGLSTPDPEIIRRMMLAGLKYGFTLKRSAPLQTHRWWDYRLVGTTGKRPQDIRRPATMRTLMEAWGIPRGLSKNKVIPDCVFSLPNDQLARFLAVFWMSDGYVAKDRGPGITLASEEMVRQLQHLLLRFGVQSGVKHKLAKNGDKYFDCWKLTVYDSREFAGAIPLWGEKKRRLDAICAKPSNPNMGYPKIPRELELAIRREAQSGVKAGLWKETWTRVQPKKRGTSDLFKRGTIFGPLFRPFLDVYGLGEKYGWLLGGDIWWDTIVSIEPAGERHVFDLTVEPTACFVANDVVLHNSSSVMVVACMFAPGPLFAISARPDLLYNTARLRERMGRVLHWDAYGRNAPGTVGVSFSVVGICRDPLNRRQVSKDLAHYIDQSEYAMMTGYGGHTYFARRVELVLNEILAMAVLLGHDDAWPYSIVSTPNITERLRTLREEVAKADLRGEQARALNQHFEQLAAILLETGAEERGATLNSTANALAIYADPVVVAAAKGPNPIDFDDLVAGRPDDPTDLVPFINCPPGVEAHLAGCYDSLFITDADVEAPTAPILMLIQLELRRAAKRLSDSRDLRGLTRQMPTTEVHDEGFVSPVPNLQHFLAIQRDQGINLMFSLHDLSQGTGRVLPSQGGASPLTLFKTNIIFPGIGDEDTLSQFSILAGEYTEERWIRTYTFSGEDPKGTTDSPQYTQRRRLEPSQIAAGHAQWPEGSLIRDNGSHFYWLLNPPYYKGEPWTRIIVQSVNLSMHRESALPLPQLAKYGYENLDALGLGDQWRRIVSIFNQWRQ